MDDRLAEMQAWRREMDRDDRMADYRMAAWLGAYSNLRWTEWAAQRKPAQATLAQAQRRLHQLLLEVASLKLENDALRKHMPELRSDQ